LPGQLDYGADASREVGIFEVSGVAKRLRVCRVAVGAVEEGIEELAIHVAVVAIGWLAVGEGGDDVGIIEAFVGGVMVADRAADRVAGAEQVPPWPAAAVRVLVPGGSGQRLSDLAEDLGIEVGGEEPGVEPLQRAAVGDECGSGPLWRVQLQHQGGADYRALAVRRQDHQILSAWC
jgi:hypothetical protein